MNVAAVILAAGASRRMGQPKQLLPFDGQSLLRRTTSVEELKGALKGEDIAEIRTATEKVAAVSQKLGQAMYADAQASQAAGGDAHGAEAPKADDDVVDAEIVDEDRRDGAA